MIHPTLGLGPEQEILRRRNNMTKKHLKKCSLFLAITELNQNNLEICFCPRQNGQDELNNNKS